MAYRLRTGESVQDGIRRVISEQIKRAIAEQADTHLDRTDVIHQIRKRIKKIRAALRLVRKGLGPVYFKENAWYRHAARPLSNLRDTTVMIETCDVLEKDSVGENDTQVIRSIRNRLKTRKEEQMQKPRMDALLQDFEFAMAAGYKRVAFLHLEGEGHGTLLAGMHKTYARAHAAMEAAYKKPTPETFHAWRKQAKYHGYHMRLLLEAWPPVLRARWNELNKLGEELGKHHNLCVFRASILKDPVSPGEKKVLMGFIKRIDKSIEQIQRESKPLGRRLFSEKPKHLARRFAIYFSRTPDED